MKPIIVTLEPMADGSESTTTVATFEEAFGEYSVIQGGDWKDYSFDGEDYFSIDGDDEYYYNAKGEKFKKGLKNFGKSVGKAGKFIGKQVKKFIGKLKPKKGARKLRKDTRNFNKSEKVKAHAEKKAKREKEIADAKAKGQTPPPPIPPLPPSNTDVKDKIVDVIPPVVNGEKINPDGSKTPVPKEDQTKVGNQIVDKKDLENVKNPVSGINPITGKEEITAEVDPKDVETLKTEDGQEIQFKKSDLIDNKSEEISKGMSKGMKIGLIVGGAVLLIGIIVVAVKSSKSNAPVK